MSQENESLDDLEKRLSIAFLRKAELENEIQTLSPTGVHNLPFELLTKIFEEMEIVDDASLQNLRLVCLLWNQVVVNSPALWSRIHIVVPSTVRGAERCNEYCIRRMERSKGRTLDISIDLRLRSTVRKIFFEKLIDDDGIADISSSITIEQWIHEGIMVSDWSRHYAEWQPKFAYLHHAHIGAKAILRHCKLSWLKPLSTLTGENGSLMTRWRSFELICQGPYDDCVKETFPQGIEIHPSCEFLRVNAPKESWQQPIKLGIVLISRQLHTLQVLDLRNVTPQGFDLTAINPLNLRHISLEYYDVRSFRFLLSCPNLEHLGFQRYDPLDGLCKSDEGQRDKIDDRQAQILRLQPIELLNLQILEIYHYLPRFLLRLIHAPFLQTLIIYTWDVIFHIYLIPEYNFKNLLPSLKRVEFRTTQHNLKWLQLSTLRFVLSNASAIEMVMIEENQLKHFLNAMSMLGNEGIKPERLKRIDITDLWVDGEKQPTILRSIEYHEGLLNTAV